MLPLDHLPRNGGASLSSDIVPPSPPDPVLELLSPLLAKDTSNEAGPSRWNAGTVRGVREKLQTAVVQNKKRRHELLLSQFANISSQIQRGQALGSDHEKIGDSLKRLNAQLGTGDPSTSFLPPTISAVERHFNALHRRDTARAHLSALKTLQKAASEVEKLEEAVWAGRGADDWVISSLHLSTGKGQGEGYKVEEGGEIVQGTSAMRTIRERRELLRGMVVEQVTDAFTTSVSFSSSAREGGGGGVTVNGNIRLPLPRRHPPDGKPSSPPPYPLGHIYTTLACLNVLPPLLDTLKNRLLKEIILPLVQSPPHLQLHASTSSHSASLTMSTTDRRPPADVLGDVKTMMDFITSTIFPSTSADLAPARSTFLAELHSEIWKSVLSQLIIPALPPSVNGVQAWLDLLAQANDAESSTQPADTSEQGIISLWTEKEAGTQWANARRYRVAEEVRKLVLGGWGGWEGMEVEVEKEITVITEVEVDEPPEAVSPTADQAGQKGAEASGEADFGWGFDDSPSASTVPLETKASPNGTANKTEPELASEAAGDEEEGGWGFDDEDAKPSAPPPTAAKPSTPPAAPAEPEGDGGEGWDFDLDPSPPPAAASSSMPPPPVPTKPATPKKPVREAKKLGRAVAKAKAAAEETQSEMSDDWGSDAGGGGGRRDSVFSDSPSVTGSGGGGGGVASMLDSLLGDTVSSLRRGSGSSHSQRPSFSSSAPPPPAQEDGWGWDEPPAPTPPVSSLTRQRGVDPSINALAASLASKKRTVRKEEKRIVKETMLVSRACEKLVEIASRIIRETEELQGATWAPSFGNAPDIVRKSLGDAFDLYRALIATHYSLQLREVPVLAMQVANDDSHLATRLSLLPLPDSSPSDEGNDATWGIEDTIIRLRGAGEGVYETFLEVQREALVTMLEEGHVAHVGTEGGWKAAERAVKQVVHNLESLGRVLKPVITTSTYLPTLGYLLDCVLFYLTGEILAMGDITEMESNRLNELLKLLHPLEELFTDPEGQPRVVEYVKGWLRFCYVSELLVANLVDITYLFDTGALVDFSTTELVNLVRALFADSPKRDAAIDKISKGAPQSQETGGGG